MVRTEFKEENRKVWGTPFMSKKTPLEEQIALTYVTGGRVDKTLAKMRESGPWTRKRIPELFSRIYNDVVEEEMWNIVKKFKDPIVNFRRLRSCIVNAVKSARPDLF